jgi:hypothetical protein
VVLNGNGKVHIPRKTLSLGRQHAREDGDHELNESQIDVAVADAVTAWQVPLTVWRKT